MNRKYLPTLSDLIDRLSIVLLKSVFASEHHGEYRDEAGVIMHDINLVLEDAYKDLSYRLTAVDIHAILVLMLANRWIWENEGDIRTTPIHSNKPDGYRDIAERLIATHSVNGVRSRAKNVLASRIGGRVDVKVDCLAADLPPEMGNWDVF